MKRIIFTILLTLIGQEVQANASGAATGIEVGYGKVNQDEKSASGTSWMYHFEFNADKSLNFFGQAGQTRAMKTGTNLTQTTFSGGIGLDLIPALEFRVGAAITDTHGKDAFGALLGCAFKISAGAFLTGPSVTYIGHSEEESVALRWLLLLRL